MERIEPDKDELGKCIVSAGQDAIISAGANALECMTDCVATRRAGIRDHLAWGGNAESVLRIDHRFLRGIIRNQ